MATDPELRKHQDWIGFVQPVGLVVSAPALASCQAYVNRNLIREQEQFKAMVGEAKVLSDFRAFTGQLLGWQTADLVEPPVDFGALLAEYHETLRPTFVVPNPDAPGQYLALVQVLASGTDLDGASADDTPGWQASPQTRFERLLRETNNPIGVLCNGASLRLVYAPRGETSGYATFNVASMCNTDGRTILGALLMLLGADRLFNVPVEQRLPAILKESRKYQNVVSTALAEQVLTALQALLRGFQAADEASKGALLKGVLGESRTDVYGGLLATILRLVFVLYAEDRGLMPSDGVYVRHYSASGLFERLRSDAARFPDTMDQRFGAWAQLLTLFRFIFDGAAHGTMHMPARHGRLFSPDVYPFLEGRAPGSVRISAQRLDPPRVSDGTVLRVLENLLILDGERLSYRALDVEQIGSVYEAMMGFELEVAKGKSLAIRPHHVVVNLDDILKRSGKPRTDALEEETDCKLAAAAAKAFQAAKTVDELVAALDRRVSPQTRTVLPPGALYLQPGHERRRSGSHYTPRTLTEPIVRKTLSPVLEALGPNATPDQILDLKVCDPAMGSGAFLVEACRFLGEALKEAWARHKSTPPIPPDEDLVLHARRVIAQRCLYGVDKNPFAVDLAKLSLWLVTLAREHPFTFLDHALRCGDSLVGLTREQVACFHWSPEKQLPTVRRVLDEVLKTAESKRREIHALGDTDNTDEKERLHREAQEATARVRAIGDAVCSIFLTSANDRVRRELRANSVDFIDRWVKEGEPNREIDEALHVLRHDYRIPPFHWELEFPEVFTRTNPGFDAFLGNPPFMGGTIITGSIFTQYLDWLKKAYPGSGNRTDLVAYFFRRAFDHLRTGGTLGLLATNTIAQGDTRDAGLKQILARGGHVYEAVASQPWPGSAAVFVAVVHLAKGPIRGLAVLDGRPVAAIDSRLQPKTERADPKPLRANENICFKGSQIYGQGFILTPSERDKLVSADPTNAARIFPYLGGEEVNSRPQQDAPHYVIDFAQLTLEEAGEWPTLLEIVRERVKPERDLVTRDTIRKNWWRFADWRVGLHEATSQLERCLVTAEVTKHLMFSFQPTNRVFSQKLYVLALDSVEAWGVLQSRIHVTWAWLLSSTMKEDLSYTPSACFDTFPFPNQDPRGSVDALHDIAERLYASRAKVMSRGNQGLTTTYNQLKDHDCRDENIVRLRELHLGLDRAVWAAYGWPSISIPPYTTPRTDAEKQALESFEDEVIDRLFALNAERAEEEKLKGTGADTPAKPTKRKKAAKSTSPDQLGLLEEESK